MRSAIIVVLLFSISALVLITSNETITLFSGSHQILDITSTGNDISCTSCHSHIQNEFSKSKVHGDLDCIDCHRLEVTSSGESISYSVHNDTGWHAGNQSHAAYTPTCLDCHGGNGVQVDAKFAPPAPAFNQTDYGSDYSAHKPFVEYASISNSGVGENEACIACHTNYSMEIEYSYWWNINYTLRSWNFTEFNSNGSREYNSNFDKSGAKHEFLSVDNISCTGCHQNIYEALVIGTEGDNEDYLTHSPIEINHSDNHQGWNTFNPWEHYRYHYIDSNRAERVNNSYCFECHNVKKYADEHPSQKLTYSLDDVTSNTNSTSIHAAEIVWCQTCHGTGKTKEVIDNPERTGLGHSQTDFVDKVKDNFSRTYTGDICMGCHEAAVHPEQGCGRCHESSNERARVYIESEPSGYAQNIDPGHHNQ
ncbi:MAG: hypothetical protein ACLFVI_06705 [Archaeoglobaceae archaeon]